MSLWPGRTISRPGNTRNCPAGSSWPCSRSASGSHTRMSSLKLMYSQPCILSTSRLGRTGRPGPMEVSERDRLLVSCSSIIVDHASLRSTARLPDSTGLNGTATRAACGGHRHRGCWRGGGGGGEGLTRGLMIGLAAKADVLAQAPFPGLDVWM